MSNEFIIKIIRATGWNYDCPDDKLTNETILTKKIIRNVELKELKITVREFQKIIRETAYNLNLISKQEFS